MSISNSHLASLKPGHVATIANLSTSSGLHQRLQALGFRQGRKVTMLRRSWLSGPVHVRVGTTEVMLRLQDAQRIAIVPLLSRDNTAGES
ncbi:MAG TPA: FeoA family protein [Allocoleopsis sp.]